MKKILVISSAIFFFSSCCVESQEKDLRYNNIIILSDMSSRLKNKPQKDIEEIKEIIRFFKDECVKPGKKIGDKSSLSFSTFSRFEAISIDINGLKNLGEKQRYINSTGEYRDKGLDYELLSFEKKILEVYDSLEDSGLDLISLLLEKIENTSLVKEDTFYSDGVNRTNVKFDNLIYIFTDGYLEYKGKNKNSQFHYGISEIKRVREYCIKNKVDIAQALEGNISFCLPAIKSSKNKMITLHIKETHERDKNDNSLTYDHTLGQRDNEILEAVWKKWAKESGFKNLIWEKY